MSIISFPGGPNVPVWGVIQGTLSDQTDLQAASDAKANATTGTIGLLSTTTFDFNVATKQTLYTVPASSICLVEMVRMRSASASLASVDAPVTLGFNAGADDLWGANSIYYFPQMAINRISTSLLSISRSSSMARGFDASSASVDDSVLTIGTAAQVLGVIYGGTPVTETVEIDVFGYLVSV